MVGRERVMGHGEGGTVSVDFRTRTDGPREVVDPAECGAELPTAARFCPECGTPAVAAPERETRRTVTLLFTDVTGVPRSVVETPQ